MAAVDDAFADASGKSPEVIAALAGTALCAVLVVLIARCLMGLWDSHQAGSLEGSEAGQHALRLGLLMVFVFVIVVWAVA
jgi:hypothetical protein